MRSLPRLLLKCAGAPQGAAVTRTRFVVPVQFFLDPVAAPGDVDWRRQLAGFDPAIQRPVGFFAVACADAFDGEYFFTDGPLRVQARSN